MTLLDLFRDRIRVTCSIVSHTFCAATVYQFCKNDLKSIDKPQDLENVDTDSTDLQPEAAEMASHDESSRDELNS